MLQDGFYMKRRLKGLICLILCLSLSVPAFALTENDTDKISYLSDRGFPIELLEILQPEDLNELYLGVKNGTILYGGTATQKLSEPGSIVPHATRDIDYLNLGITHTFNMGSSGDGAPKIESVGMYINYEWTNGRPAVTRTDTITVNWDEDLFYATAFSATSAAFLKDGGYVEIDSWSNPSKLTQGGLGYLAELSYNLGGVESHVGYANFDLKPRMPIYYGDDLNTPVEVEYVHCNDLGEVTVGFNIGVFSISGNISGDTESIATNTDFSYSL